MIYAEYKKNRGKETTAEQKPSFSSYKEYRAATGQTTGRKYPEVVQQVAVPATRAATPKWVADFKSNALNNAKKSDFDAVVWDTNLSDQEKRQKLYQAGYDPIRVNEAVNAYSVELTKAQQQAELDQIAEERGYEPTLLERIGSGLAAAGTSMAGSTLNFLETLGGYAGEQLVKNGASTSAEVNAVMADNSLSDQQKKTKLQSMGVAPDKMYSLFYDAEKNKQKDTFWSNITSATDMKSGRNNNALYEIDTVNQDPSKSFAKSLLNLSEQKQNEALAGLNETWQFLGSTGISIVQNIANILFSGGAAPLTMGFQAAGSAMYDAQQRGGTLGQQVLYGTLAGAAETIGESISFGGLSKLAEGVTEYTIKDGLKNFAKESLKKIGAQMGTEFGEEAATEVMNIVSDLLVMGDAAEMVEYFREYAAAHPGETRALAILKTVEQALVQVGTSGLAGGISGGVLGPLGMMVSGFKASQIGASIKAQGVDAVQEIIDSGKEMDQTSAAYRMANRLEAKLQQANGDVTKLSANDIGRQYHANLQQQETQALQQFESDLQTIGLDAKTQKAAVRAYQSLTEAGAARKSDIQKLGAAVKQAAAVQAETKADLIATKTEIKTRLDGIYAKMQQAYETGDVRAFAQAKQEYSAAYQTAQAKNQAATIKAENKVEQARQTVTETVETLNREVQEERLAQAAQARQEAVQAQQEAFAQATEESAAQGQQDARGGIVRQDTGKVTREQRIQLRVLDQLSKMSNIPVVVVDSTQNLTLPDGRVNHSDSNGFYDPKTNTIYVARDAISGAYLFTGVHELVHSIKVNNPEGYALLRDFVLEHLVDNPKYAQMLAERGEDLYTYADRLAESQGLEPEEALEEIVCDAVPVILTDESIVRELVEKDRTLAEHIRDFFKEFFQKLQKIMNNVVREFGRAEIGALQDDANTVREIYDLFMDALEGGAEPNKNRTNTRLTSTRLQSPVAVTEYGSIGKVADSDNSVKPRDSREIRHSPRLPADFADKVDIEQNYRDIANMEPVAEMSGNEFAKGEVDLITQVADFFESIGGSVVSPDLGKITLSKNGVRSDLAHGIGRKKAVAFAAVPDVIKHGKIIDVQYNWKGRDYDTVVIAAPVTIGGEDLYEGVIVNKNSGDDTFYLHEVVTESASSFKTVTSNNASPNGKDTLSVIRILQKIGDYKSDSQKNTDSDKIRRSVKDVTPQEKKDHNQAAVEYFGRTFRWSETGYLLLDGKKLDFSGRHEGAPGGYRTVDHRDISDALGEDYGGDDYSGAMIQFMSEGNIRISPESSGINLSVQPTKAQEEALSDFISKERGEVMLDIDTPDGRTVVSVEYPRGTRSSKVLNDIRQYFEEGTKPYVSELAQFRYSMKNVSPANMETLMATVEEQQEIIDALKAQFKLSKGYTPDAKTVKRLAGKILTEYQSKYDKATLAENLTKLFTEAGTAKDFQWSDIMDAATSIAKAVVEESRELDTTQQETGRRMRDYFRQGFSLTEAQKAEVANVYGSLNEFRKRNMGRLRLTDDGMSLDGKWEEIAGKFPDFFDADTKETDMPLAIAEALETVKPTYHNPYGYNLDSVAYDLALQIFDGYLETPATKTFADRMRDRGYQQVQEARKQARTQTKARISEQQNKKKYRTRIEKDSKELIRWFEHPTDAKHIPASMREAIGEFLGLIDFDGPRGGARPFEAALDRLRAVVDPSANREDIYLDFDPDLVADIDNLRNSGITRLNDLNAQQMRELSDIVRAVKHAVTTANKLLGQQRYETVAEAGQATMGYLNAKKAAKSWGKLDKARDLLSTGMMDSFSYFDRLGDGGRAILKGLRQGFDQKVTDIRQAERYMQKVTEGLNTKDWSGKKAKATAFQVSGGTLELTPAQVMELYLLNKREQARGHIYGGGVRVESQKKLGKELQAQPVTLTEEDVANIIGTLTEKQRAAADKMQAFLSEQCAEWGNEASMLVYGYDKFTEQDYYPIRSDQNYTHTNDQDAQFAAVRAYGMTKATVKGANNPLVLGDIFDTFTRHVDEMSSYHGFLAPLGNAMKWYNYKARTDNGGYTGSVKQSIDRVMGKEGKAYFMQFIRDLNGLAQQSNAGMGSVLFRNAKTAAVGANARVVLQQPTAYLRASAMISPKYLAKAVWSKPAIQKAKANSGIAQWKSWGFYDINVGKSLREIIVGDQTAVEKVKEASLKPAGWADELTWGALWNACELEVRDKQPGLKGEDFDAAVAERFSDIVDRTQVVDTVFHRSQVMRQKGLTELYTAFMSEPTKTYNMLLNAAEQFAESRTKENGKALVRTVTTYAFTALATAIAAGLADAFRDDDEEKDFWAKYTGAVKANFGDNINPLNLIPVVKDVLSIIEGYDASRLDLQGAEKLVSAVEGWYKHFNGTSRKSTYAIFYESMQGISSVTGIPAGNLMRIGNSIYGTFAVGGYDWKKQVLTGEKLKLSKELEAAGVEGGYGFLQDMSETVNAGKLTAIATYDKDKDGKPDYDDKTQRLIADVLGIKVPTGVKVADYAATQAQEYIEKQRKDEDLDPKKLQEKEDLVALWFKNLGRK